MESFNPDEIVRQIPELAKMLEIRELLTDLKARVITNRASGWPWRSIVKDQSQVEAIMRELDRVAPLPEGATSSRRKVTDERPRRELVADERGRDHGREERPPFRRRTTIVEERASCSTASSRWWTWRHRTAGEAATPSGQALAGAQPAHPLRWRSGHVRSSTSTRPWSTASSPSSTGRSSAQVNEILHHEEFQKLESAWRGLKFLVDRTDFRRNIQIEILNVSKEELAVRLRGRPRSRSSRGCSSTSTCRSTTSPAASRSAPSSATTSSRNHPQDIALLGNLSKIAAGLPRTVHRRGRVRVLRRARRSTRCRACPTWRRSSSRPSTPSGAPSATPRTPATSG